MVQQMVLSQVIKKQINNFGESAKTESRSENATAKLTATQKRVVAEVARASGGSTSSVISDAVEFYVSHLDHIEKMYRYQGTIESLLNDLP